MATERERVQKALRASGIEGVEDFGRFVNNRRYFEPSQFDEVGASGTLLRLLPSLDDPAVVATVARHLRNGPIRPQGFEPLFDAFRRWAPGASDAGWALGDALPRAADDGTGDAMVALANDKRYGQSRQMIVFALWRWRRRAPVEATLRALIDDPDVSYQAMSALGRVIEPNDLEALLADVALHAEVEIVRKQAERHLRKVRKKLARPSNDDR